MRIWKSATAPVHHRTLDTKDTRSAVRGSENTNDSMGIYTFLQAIGTSLAARTVKGTCSILPGARYERSADLPWLHQRRAAGSIVSREELAETPAATYRRQTATTYMLMYDSHGMLDHVHDVGSSARTKRV